MLSGVAFEFTFSDNKQRSCQEMMLKMPRNFIELGLNIEREEQQNGFQVTSNRRTDM